MQWEGQSESENVDDRRGFGTGGRFAVGGVGGLILIGLALFFGVDPRELLNPQGEGGAAGPGPGGNPQVAQPANPEDEKLAHFAKVILHDTEIVWDEQFRKLGREYVKPTLVLFTGRVDSACGSANAAVGPFYCGRDSEVYIDLSFFKQMQRKLNSPGEFARAYVLAHEVGHHVQHLLGYAAIAEKAGRIQGEHVRQQMSVRMELQADYFAGVWAHHAQEKFHFLDRGDVESAMHAAFEIGDDHLQQKARGYVVPDSFTHGTSQQRMRWFKKGFETGNVDDARLLIDLGYDKL
jgi:predicted metalloprotease